MTDTPKPRSRKPRFTLRDQFAAAALPAIITTTGPGKNCDPAAVEAYRCADAMLRARAK